jgi:hypothetical protein
MLVVLDMLGGFFLLKKDLVDPFVQNITGSKVAYHPSM